MLERYELVRLLGRGAAGEVYLARDRLLAGREVALKRISIRVDEALRGAFEREFATMASLSVPGVAQVYDFGVAPGDGPEGVTFYTRAYIDGRPLDKAAVGASTVERVRLFAKVARVIAPLHRVGVVHGDIKPGNAIIDARGQAHVIDFGLARVMGRDRGAEATGGTLPFMAPELLRGERPSVQSDVFALGATLWSLLTDSLPFGRRGLLDGETIAPPALPDGIDALTAAALEVARRALTREPLDRLPTVDELLAALDKAVPDACVETEKRVFVQPRPRGHSELLDRLQAVVSAPNPVAGSGRTVLVVAPAGGGKSLVLRELKWRLQIRAVQVLEVSAASGDLTESLVALTKQIQIGVGADQRGEAATARALNAIRDGQLAGTELSDALAEGFGVLRARGSTALLVDDLDAAEALFGAIVRSALFADTAGGVVVIASASDADAPAVKGLGPTERMEVPRLPRIEQQSVVTDALGPVDASVLDALYEHTQGLPAALMDALAALFLVGAPTVADVRALPPAGVSLALAHARIARAPAGAERLLAVLAVVGQTQSETRLGEMMEALDAKFPLAEGLVARCEAVDLLVRRPEGVGLRDVALEKALLQGLAAHGTRDIAERLLAAVSLNTLSVALRAHLAVLAGNVSLVRELVPEAGRQLVAMGAHGAARELYESLLACSEGPLHEQTLLALARCYHALGELERAAAFAQRLLASGALSIEMRADAAIASAQALTALGRFDEAVATLSLVPQDCFADVRARVQRELAKVHLRRGDYDALCIAADAGLACVQNEVLRSELLCARGMVASYRADHEAARRYLEEAISLARHAESAREEANALATLSIVHFRTGDLLGARDLSGQCLEIARRLGDVGSMANFALNLGGLLFCLGEPAGAAEHYESAARLANRAGRLTTQAQARTNLAHLHIYFGLYERAKGEVSEMLAYAVAAGHKYIRAQTSALFGDLAARSGDLDHALIHYDDAITRYAELGQTREIAEHHLDAAEALLDRGGPADTSAAAARLATAREPIAREKIADLEPRLTLLLARARIASGEAEGALASLDHVIERARAQRNRELEWRALSAAAEAHEVLGAEFAARRSSRLAVEVLEDIALRIPREHREAFWHDPRRRSAREKALHAEDSLHRPPSASAPISGDLATLIGDPRADRLLEIIKRLAGEPDLDRLLQRITESAVDLSGAERGYVLLVDKQGQLEKHTTQVAKSEPGDPHSAFSRSIAEAVLIDGEPIVTVDATHDGRLQEYISVHKLMLRSVACLPIQGRTGTVGVLYLEHRRSRGRFSEACVALLHAFADQAAIALENARLNAENLRRQHELESANQALANAKHDLEELLCARTESLLEAQRELTRTRKSARTKATRHGMVGRSPAMLRVFDTIDRVQAAKVPVVIQGESGTGKDLVAHAIHDASTRARAPFVVLNCGSVPESLVESELFGHVEGAFSGADRSRSGLIARASGGTLFLDEVGDMPPRMQVDLLRALQEGTVCKVGGEIEEKVDVRYITASIRRLEELVQEGRFREDLYYRLSVVEIVLPPLRERREDIPLLCEHFLQTFAERDALPPKRLTRAALEVLLAHALPGNVRQLEHVLLQAWVLVSGPSIDAADLMLEYGRGSSAPPPSHEAAVQIAPVGSLEDYRVSERTKILSALEAHGWNRARAAKALGMPRRTFYRRLEEHEIR